MRWERKAVDVEESALEGGLFRVWVPCCCAADRLSVCASHSLPLNSARSQQSVGSPLRQLGSSMLYAAAELMLMSCCPTTPQAMNESSKLLNLTSLCGLGPQ